MSGGCGRRLSAAGGNVMDASIGRADDPRIRIEPSLASVKHRSTLAADTGWQLAARAER
jgi:hypothetical protein